MVKVVKLILHVIVLVVLIWFLLSWIDCDESIPHCLGSSLKGTVTEFTDGLKSD